MEIKENIELLLDDLDKLNELYSKDYLTLEEWYNAKNRILDKMLNDINNSKVIPD